MPNKDDKNRTRKPSAVSKKPDVVAQEQSVEPSAEQPKKKYTYNPTTAKAYRDRIMDFAKQGGYEPKPKSEGTGLTEKRTSKTGTTYYYQPWSTLTDDQKKTRLAQARERSAKDRELARKYREEHSEATVEDN